MKNWVIHFICICALLASELNALCQSEEQSEDLGKLTPEQQDELYQQLLEKSAEMGKPYQDPPPDAFDFCRNGDVEALRHYLDNGGDPNWDKQTAGIPSPLLLWAILMFHNECAELLIDRGANVNAPAFNVGNISTAAGLKLIDVKMTQFHGKGNSHAVEQLSKAVDLLAGHGAIQDKPFLVNKSNEVGARAWKHAQDRGDAIVQAECKPDAISLPAEQISMLSVDDSESLEAWLKIQAGKTNMVIAVVVFPGGDESEKRLLDLCMKYDVRMFTHQVILDSE